MGVLLNNEEVKPIPGKYKLSVCFLCTSLCHWTYIEKLHRLDVIRTFLGLSLTSANVKS